MKIDARRAEMCQVAYEEICKSGLKLSIYAPKRGNRATYIFDCHSEECSESSSEESSEQCSCSGDKNLLEDLIQTKTEHIDTVTICSVSLDPDFAIPAKAIVALLRAHFQHGPKEELILNVPLMTGSAYCFKEAIFCLRNINRLSFHNVGVEYVTGFARLAHSLSSLPSLQEVSFYKVVKMDDRKQVMFTHQEALSFLKPFYQCPTLRSLHVGASKPIRTKGIFNFIPSSVVEELSDLSRLNFKGEIQSLERVDIRLKEYELSGHHSSSVIQDMINNNTGLTELRLDNWQVTLYDALVTLKPATMLRSVYIGKLELPDESIHEMACKKLLDENFFHLTECHGPGSVGNPMFLPEFLRFYLDLNRNFPGRRTKVTTKQWLESIFLAKKRSPLDQLSIVFRLVHAKFAPEAVPLKLEAI